MAWSEANHVEWLREELAGLLGLPAHGIDVRARFRELGLESSHATALIAKVGLALGRTLSPTLAWEHPSVEALARHLASGAAERFASLPAVRASSGAHEPIAIVGMSCRLPGGVRSPEDYWRLLREGIDAITEVPPDRWDAGAFYDPDVARPGKSSTRWGGFLDRIDAFDAQFFGISPREAQQMDPQQRIFLELAHEALEDAAIAPDRLRGSTTGVYAGVMWNDYARVTAARAEQIVQHTATGLDSSIVSARISYALGLEGPSLSVNTACSSSLVAVHLACQALRSGEADLALAGGVNLLLAPHSTVAMTKFGAMAPDGRSKAFDARANGYVRAEGAGLVVLKPLSRALADGDRIACVILGGAVNNDGFSNGLTAPSPKAQEAVLGAAYARAGVDPAGVQYVEAHGTGTFLGDPIEANALGAVLGAGRAQPLLIGSVKSNLGHAEAAAGIAGLIKVALSIERGAIPKSLHFETPNPHIAFEALGLEVPRELRPWPAAEGARRAGVSSFGFGGTNCHLVLGDLPAGSARVRPLGRGLAEDSQARGPAPPLVFVCPGHGPQWMGMGLALLRAEPVFRVRLAEIDRALAAHSGWSVIEALGCGSRARLEDAAVIQPALFAIQLALAALWEDWGIVPEVVVGHSQGEIAAACLAGILDLDDAARLIVRRGEIVRQRAGQGGMLAIALPVSEVELPEGLVIGAVNGPESTVVSGALGPLDAFAATLAARGVRSSRVPIAYASHSPEMAPLALDLARAAEGIAPRRAALLMLSTVRAEPLEGPECGPAYWGENLRRPVRFEETIARFLGLGPATFVELSPHPVLTRAIEQTARAHGVAVQVWPSGRRDGEHAAILGTLAGLSKGGASVRGSRVSRAAIPGDAGEARPIPVLPLSAKRPDALPELARRYLAHLDAHPELAWEDLAATAGTGRSHFPHRLAIAAPSRAAARATLVLESAAIARSAEPSRRPRIAFLSPSAEAPSKAAIRELSTAWPVFRAAFEQALVAETSGPPGKPACPPLDGDPNPSGPRVPGKPACPPLDGDPNPFGPRVPGKPACPPLDGDPNPFGPRVPGKPACPPLDGDPNPSGTRSVAFERALAALWRSFGVVPDDPASDSSAGGDLLVILGAGSPAGDSVASLEAGRSPRAVLAESVARLYAAGVAVDWAGYHAEQSRPHLRVPLPSYPFEALRCWPEGGLLGPRLDAAGAGAVFESELGTREQPYLADHHILGEVVLPAAMVWELLRAAAEQVLGPGPHAIAGFELDSPVILSGVSRRIQVVVSPPEPEGTRAALFSRAADTGAPWVPHGGGALRSVPPVDPAVLDLTAIRARCPRVLDPDAAYAALAAAGLAYGPAFRSLTGLFAGEQEVLAHVRLPAGAPRGFGVHPILLDGALQAAIRAFGEDAAFLPVGAAAVTLLPADTQEAWVHATMAGPVAPDAELITAELRLADPDGRVFAVLAGLRLKRAARGSLRDRATPAPPRLQHLEWQAVAPGDQGRLRGRWALLDGGCGALAQALADRLAGAGAEPSFLSIEALHDALRSTPFEGVVVLWPDPFVGSPIEAAELQLTQALRIAHALAAPGLATPPRLGWVTRGAEGSDAGLLTGAALGGFARSLALEHPELRSSLLELDPAAQRPADLDAIVAALSGFEAEPELRIRRGAWQAPRWRTVAQSPPGRSLFGPGGSVLITGGLGALGLHTARWLVESCGVRDLILAGRRGPSPSAAGAIDALREAGAQVSSAVLDVSRQEEVRELLASIDRRAGSPPLRGIIHAAGVLADGTILSGQDAARLATVFGPKARGAWNLHQATLDRSLDAFVLFSSVASVLGAAGQSNYAAANAVLDGLARHRRSLGLPALSVAWGPWSGGGMANRADPVRMARFARQGLGHLAPAEALRALDSALRQPEPVVVVASRVRPPEFDFPKPSGVRSRTTSGDRPPAGSGKSNFVLRDSRRRESRAPSAPGSRIGLPARIAAADREDRRAALADWLKAEVAKVLALPSPALVPENRPFKELGLDSLLAGDLRNALSAQLGKLLPATLAFDHPTIRALASHLADLSQPCPEPPRAKPGAAPIGGALEPIAIVGLGCRYPGGVRDPASFWRLLEDEVDAIGEIPPDRWDAGALYDSNPDSPGKITTRSGGFLSGVDEFDPGFFGIGAREADKMDPQQRLLLETSWEALENAGLPPETLMDTQTGVFAGLMYHDYASVAGASLSDLDGHVVTGTLGSVASGRISYVLGLKGPSLTVDTACSSSLVAVHLACQSLRAGECAVALAGGATVMLSPAVHVEFSRLRGLSADGRSKSFDASADGVGWSEGCGVLVLRRLSDALAAGDPILALIRGTAVNQDGRSNGLTAPHGPSQEAVIRRALEQAGVAPADVGYVEAHGTGTPLGDPIEVQALAAVLGEGRQPDQPLIVGSVKSNLGHTQAAAGVAGIAKVVLALSHERIPRSIHFSTPNPRVPWSSLPIAIAARSLPWPSGERRRIAGVSSFGISGTNAHAILDEPPEPPIVARSGWPLEIVPLSGKTPAALRAAAERLEAWLLANPGAALADVAFTAALRRPHHEHRLAVAGASTRAVAAGLRRFLRAPPPPATKGSGVVFVFPAARRLSRAALEELRSRSPAFREAVATAERALRAAAGLGFASVEGSERALRAAAGLGLPSVEGPERADVAPLSVAAGLALQVGLVAAWRAFGIEPTAAVGLGTGEIAAAWASGALSLEEAAALALALDAAPARRVPAAAVRGSVAEVRERADLSGVEIVPREGATILAGEAAALEAVLSHLSEAGIASVRLGPIDPRVLDPARVPAASGSPALPLYTSASAIERASAAGHTTFVEISPEPSALPGLATTLLDTAHFAFSLRPGTGGTAPLLAGLAMLHAGGYPVRFAPLHPGGGRVVLLPTYPFQRTRHWARPTHHGTEPARSAAGHPLLGAGVRLSTQPGTRVFERALAPDTLGWLSEHRVDGVALVPAAAWAELAISAARAIQGDQPVVVEALEIHAPLVLDPARPTLIQAVTQQTGESIALRIAAQAGLHATDPAEWTHHATARVRTLGAREALVAPAGTIRDRLGPALEGPAFYEAQRARGLHYGPAFQGVQRLWRGQDEALGEIALPGAGACFLDPAALDAALQVLLGIVLGPELDAHPLVPVSFGQLCVHGRLPHRFFSHVRLLDPLPARTTPKGPLTKPKGLETDGTGAIPGDPASSAINRSIDIPSAQVTLFDESGRVFVSIDRLRTRSLARALPAEPGDDRFLAHVWRPAPSLAAPATTGRWLVLGGEAAHPIARRLEAHGAAVQVLDSVPPADLFVSEPLSGVVHALALDPAAPSAPSSRDAASVLQLVQALAGARTRNPPRLWLITRGAQPAGTGLEPISPLPALLWGLARTIAAEHPELRVARLDLDPAAPPEEPELVARELLAEEVVQAGLLEEEIALRGSGRWVGRLVRRAPGQARLPTLVRGAEPGRAYRLGIDRPGVLDRLALREVERRSPGPGEVEVEVATAGLNFLDVLKAMGVYPGQDAGDLGAELAGHVVTLGPGVSDLAVGDRVAGVTRGAFASHVVLPRALVAPLPASLSLEAGGGLPVVAMTAQHALFGLARLEAGERVLIHSATGGTGLAAVLLARRAGARVFATAGNAEKRAFLVALGVERAMDSRSVAFADEVLEATDGQGVDVVLNSLTGAAIEKGLSALAPYGRFVELGKRDIYDGASLPLAAFRRKLSYFAVDLAGMIDERPAQVARLLAEVLALAAEGVFAPLPIHTISADRAAEAFQSMAQARHLGKLVLGFGAQRSLERPVPVAVPKAKFRRVGSEVGTGTTKSTRLLELDPAASYLITGGLGGLGLALAAWLVERGARHLVLVGRGGASSVEQRRAIADLEARGARVLVARADVADRDQLRAALADAASALPPIRGVVHAAGVLDDGLLVDQRPDRFARVMAPKVDGAWNLHLLTAGLELDFFVLYGSASSLLGLPGQGSYAAANAFLSALAQHRRRLGLPALCVDFGAFSGVGMAAEHGVRGDRLAAQGLGSLTPAEGHVALEALLLAGEVALGVVPLDVRQWIEAHPHAVSSSLFSELAAVAQAGPARPSTALAGDLSAAPPAERLRRLEGWVREQLGKVLRIDASQVAREAPLRNLGVDSLAGLELRNRLEHGLGRELSATLIWTHSTLEALTGHLAGLFAAPAERSTGVEPTPPPPRMDRATNEVRGLSEAEMEAAILAELARLSGEGE